jgi:tripartite-type tricarboxylate transporter receptor subunit TctC
MPNSFASSRLALVIYSALAGMALTGLATAADFASQTTRIVVPFAPGGGTDIISRTLAQEMSKSLGGTVIVENKPGAGTIIGTDYVAKAQADGHTLVMETFANAVNPSLRDNMPYNAEADFAPVALVARSFNIVVVKPNSGIDSVADLIAAAKVKPGALNYGTYGPGTSAHLAGELFNSLAKVKMTAIHYRGAAPAITDLLRGTVQVMFTSVASATSLIKAGQLKALAVTSAARTPAFPDVPTVAEAGVPGYEAEGWYGLFAPAKTPPAAIALLNKAVDSSLHSPAFNKLVANEGLTLVGGTPAQLGQYVQRQAARWHKVVDEAGIKIK